MKITDEMLRAAELAHMIEDICGCTNASGERVFCDDKSLPAPDSVCHCKNGARVILEAALAAAPAVLVGAPKVKALEWSAPEKPDGKSSFYDHCSAESAIGKYLIEWKSWKDYPGFTIESALGWFGCEYSLDDAKAAAQADYEHRILSALKSEEPK